MGIETFGLGEIESRKHEQTSKIALRFFRHSIKENDKTKTDPEIALTPAGRALAKNQASSATNMAQAVAFGSPRIRTQETAGLVMAGGRGDITGSETLEELRTKLNAELHADADVEYGTKIGVSDLLDFVVDDTTEFGKIFFDAYREGRYLQFIVQDSDQKAVELHDKTNDTYSRMASRIATLVQKYVAIAPRFDALVADPKKTYADTMERFLGTHQGVAESFLAKVIEKTKGIAERDRFVVALGNTGFGFTEGFGVDIQTFKDGKRTIHLSFKKENSEGGDFVFDEDVPMEVVDTIVAEGLK